MSDTLLIFETIQDVLDGQLGMWRSVPGMLIRSLRNSHEENDVCFLTRDGEQQLTALDLLWWTGMEDDVKKTTLELVMTYDVQQTTPCGAGGKVL